MGKNNKKIDIMQKTNNISSLEEYMSLIPVIRNNYFTYQINQDLDKILNFSDKRKITSPYFDVYLEYITKEIGNKIKTQKKQILWIPFIIEEKTIITNYYQVFSETNI